MAEPTLLSDIEAPSFAPPTTSGSRRRRLLALGLVLCVSFSHFIVTAFYYLFQEQQAINRYHSQISVFGALLTEVTGLLVLWFVLSGHKRSWTETGWTPRWMDVVWAVALIVSSRVAARIIAILFQIWVRSFTGHYMQPRGVHGVTGAGVSLLTVLFVLVNPLFEELIVRGYLMSEIVGLGGGRNLAIFLSVLIQMSYHVYQGLVRCIALTVVFLIFSIYFSRTRRIVPVVIAHFWSDALALMRMA